MPRDESNITVRYTKKSTRGYCTKSLVERNKRVSEAILSEQLVSIASISFVCELLTFHKVRRFVHYKVSLQRYIKFNIVT